MGALSSEQTGDRGKAGTTRTSLEVEAPAGIDHRLQSSRDAVGNGEAVVGTWYNVL